MTGLYGAYGVLLALRERDQSGKGQFIDLALRWRLQFLDEIASVYDKTGFVRERSGTETHSAVPHSHYQTGDGRWVTLRAQMTKCLTDCVV